MKIQIATGILLMVCLSVSGQAGRRDIRQGNRHFKAEKFEQAEASYKKAAAEPEFGRIAEFNTGDALYRQKKFEEAGQQFEASASNDLDRSSAAKSYHNLGNAMLQSGKIDESIEAYKQALRRNPSDLETKYNLTYAMMLKKKQEQQQQQNQDQQDNKDQQQEKQQENQQNQEQNKDQKEQDGRQQSQPQQQQQQQQDQQQSEPRQAKISREDAQRLLEALAHDEKKTQDKVKKEKAKAGRVRTLKDW